MSLKVLVIDDDDVIVYLHNLLLEEFNITNEPVNFDNGEKALEYLQAQNHDETNYLLLLDINMPVMNGWRLLDHIKTSAFSDKVFVVIATSSIDYEDHVKAKEYPQVVDYFEKPLDDRSFNRIKKIPAIKEQLPGG